SGSSFPPATSSERRRVSSWHPPENHTRARRRRAGQRDRGHMPSPSPRGERKRCAGCSWELFRVSLAFQSSPSFLRGGDDTNLFCVGQTAPVCDFRQRPIAADADSFILRHFTN